MLYWPISTGQIACHYRSVKNPYVECTNQADHKMCDARVTLLSRMSNVPGSRALTARRLPASSRFEAKTKTTSVCRAFYGRFKDVWGIGVCSKVVDFPELFDDLIPWILSLFHTSVSIAVIAIFVCLAGRWKRPAET